MSKSKPGAADQPTAPTSFPVATPQPSLDQSFTLPTIMTMQHQLGGIAKQLEHVEKRLDEIGGDVKVHGRWLFAANAVIAIVIAIIAFLAPRLWDLLIQKGPGK